MRMGKATLILNNANLIPCGPDQPRKGAIAIRGERIIALGSDEELAPLKGPGTRIVNCRGKTLMPGFIDAHCHVFSLARKLLSLELSPAFIRSIDDVKSTIRQRAQELPQGSWITGTDYNEFYLSEKRHPNRWDLDDAAPDHPVIIYHRSLHACVLNSLALKIIGITAETGEPPGGLIERDIITGEPNGVLFEMADRIKSRIPSLLFEDNLDRALMEADRRYISLGITSLGEATVNNDMARWRIYQKIKQNEKLSSRIYMMVGSGSLAEFKKSGLTTGSGDPHLRLGSVKVVINQSKGFLQPSLTELNEIALEAGEAGFQLAIHAVEKNAVEAAIMALEGLYKKSNNRLPAKTTHIVSGVRPESGAGMRHRIEHCSECPPELVLRLKKLQAVVVSQPAFIYYNGERYLAEVAKQVQPWLYPFRSLISGGVCLGASSDSPVAPNNPLTGIYAAVTRCAETGQKVIPSEAVSVRMALDMYTTGAAYASYEELDKGSLSPGKLADIVLLSSDPMESTFEQIKDIMVEMTIVGGKVVWGGKDML